MEAPLGAQIPEQVARATAYSDRVLNSRYLINALKAEISRAKLKRGQSGDRMAGIAEIENRVGRETYDAYRSTRFFGSLDGLRCFCILLVMWHHAPRVEAFGSQIQMLRRGFTGVDFFFVLSGFLITTLLLREESRNGRFSLQEFYRRRVLRIVPVYFLVVTLMAIYWIGVKGLTEHLDVLPAYYLFLANFIEDDIPLLSVTWSLSAEEQYYLIWPLMLLLLPLALRWRGGLVSALIVMCALLAADIVPLIPAAPATWQLSLYGLATSTEALLLGTLLGLVLHNPQAFRFVYLMAGRRNSALLAFAALFAAWQLLPPVLLGWPNLVMHAIMVWCLATLVLREDNVLAPLLKLGPVARIGAISYGVYLWHLVGRHIGVEGAAALGFEGRFAAQVALPIFVLSSFAIAELSFRYYESWFLRLKNRASRPRTAT